MPSKRTPRRSATLRPPPLRALRDIAAALGSGAAMDEVVCRVLELCREALSARGTDLWLHEGPEGALTRRWTVGGVDVAGTDVDMALHNDTDHIAASPISYDGRRLGALVAHEASAGEYGLLLLETVADMIAPSLGVAKYAHRLEDEVKARTAEIERQRRFIAKVVDSLPVGLYVVDRQFRVQAWNRKRETGMQGVSREDAIGRPIFEILHRQPADLLRAEFHDVFERGEVQQFTTESSASGELRIFRITKIPMRLDDRGPVSHVITVGEDMTEWREAQDRIAQAEKLAAIGTLTAGVMHEINNPLATIAACAEATALRAVESAPVVADPELHASLRDALRMIQSEVHRCKRIVDGLLDFSRPKSTDKSPVDLSAVVDRTLFLLKHHSRFKQLTVDVAPAEGPAPMVMASEEQLVQVFMSLLLNAMDAMRDRGTVGLRVIADDERVRAEVQDHGEGIRRADLQKIFEPFFTTKAPGRGTGLGLSICYGIISEHGGRIEVDSTVGRGSIFRIVLPRAQTSA